jgi:hypothetical protein
VERFQSGRTSAVDEDYVGCSTTSQTVDNVEQVNGLVREERWITVTDIANKLEISCGSAYSIIHEDKICGRWVPKQLTDEHRQRHMFKCVCNFCSDTVKERLSCNGLSQAMKYRYTTVNLKENVKVQNGNIHHCPGTRNSSVASADRVMLTLFWDFNRPIIEHYQDCRQMVNSAQYCVMCYYAS